MCLSCMERKVTSYILIDCDPRFVEKIDPIEINWISANYTMTDIYNRHHDEFLTVCAENHLQQVKKLAQFALAPDTKDEIRIRKETNAKINSASDLTEVDEMDLTEVDETWATFLANRGFSYACQNRATDVMKWLGHSETNGGHSIDYRTAFIDLATSMLKKVNVDTVKTFLEQFGSCVRVEHHVMCTTIEDGRLDVLKCLIEHQKAKREDLIWDKCDMRLTIVGIAYQVYEKCPDGTKKDNIEECLRHFIKHFFTKEEIKQFFEDPQ